MLSAKIWDIETIPSPRAFSTIFVKTWFECEDLKQTVSPLCSTIDGGWAPTHH